MDKYSVPSFCGYTPFIILSGSMSPEIEMGDLIVCKAIDAKDVQQGDVIAFYNPQSNDVAVVTHRVAEVITKDSELSFRTKGDANNAIDQVLIPAENVIARYTGVRFAGLGNVAMFMQTTAGLVVCVVIPLLLLVGYDLLRRRRIDKQRKQEADALKAELEKLRAQQTQQE